MLNSDKPNKLISGIVIGAAILGGLLYLSSGDDTNQRQTAPPQTVKNALNESVINFQEAPNHIGEYVTISGLVDNVFTSSGGTNFLNFCPNYRTCPFSAVIFNSDAYKFSNIHIYENMMVEISGVITTYQGRAQIIVKSPSQIKLK